MRFVKPIWVSHKGALAFICSLFYIFKVIPFSQQICTLTGLNLQLREEVTNIAQNSN
jgi:hypothetical protein